MKGLQGFTLSAFLLIWSTSICAQAFVIDPSLTNKIASMDADEEISVIVTLADQQNFKQFRSANKKLRRANITRALRSKALRTQKPLRDYLHKNNILHVRSFWIFNGLAITLKTRQIAELANQPDIKSITLNNTLTLPSLPPAQTSNVEWNLDAINAPAIWNFGYKGQGVIVASMDSGVDSMHPDLSSKWRGGTNSWFDPHGIYFTPHDTSGHGTQTMGAIVGGNSGGSAIGIAPEAKWIAVKIFDDFGETTSADIHAGFQWLLDPDGKPETDDSPDIVNGSWGYDIFVDQCYTEFHTDIQALKNAGIAVIFSAGNSGPNVSTSVSPANYIQSISVGSIDDQFQIANTSSRGPTPMSPPPPPDPVCDGGIFPSIVAPGENILTTDLSFGGFPHYTTVSGTSIAAPHMSGAMALILNAAPHLTISELEMAFVQSAVDLGDDGPDNDYGNGLLNILAAYNYFDSYSLYVSNGGNGSGRITSDAPGIDCPTDCHNDYIDGRVVTLTAVASPDSSFTGWSGDCSGTNTTCQVTVDKSKNVTANFYSFPWQLFTPIFSKQ